MVLSTRTSLAVAACFCGLVAGQSFQRLGTCPTLGCVFPPDQTDFLAGQLFDIRVEVHAPVNGTQATGNETPDPNFELTVARKDEDGIAAAQWFRIDEPQLETWNFTWFEDYFARDAETPSLVNVASKAYRRVALYDAGTYVATLTYNDGTKTTAEWVVRDLETEAKTKNVVLFIGDGMTTNMISAARLIAHKTVNGRYQSMLQLDKFPVVGHQMTHSIDSFITDSANSATALYTGHKSTVNALGVYRDSSEDPFDDPKFETIAELFQRLTSGGVGIVSTAFLADATPAAMTAHTADRDQYGHVIDTFLNGITNYTWTSWTGPDVLFGGGAENFLPGDESYKGQDYYQLFKDKGYSILNNNTALSEASNNEKALGVFSTSSMNVWLDRNVYKDNLKGSGGKPNAPDGSEENATDQPGLKEMTLKAIDILQARHADKGWLLMSEAASIDKQMHTLDYPRALGDLLELDDTVAATIKKLQELGTDKETLVLVTADHGHGFDIAGSVDTKYLEEQKTDREKRGAIGTYAESGLSQYVVPGAESDGLQFSEGQAFPANWDPRYTLLSAVGANPDRRENYKVSKGGPRKPAVNTTEDEDDYVVNPEDAPTGFIINGTLPVSNDQGVHSLTDVPVFAQGPCQENFGGVYNNIDIFFNIAGCLGLARNAP